MSKAFEKVKELVDEATKGVHKGTESVQKTFKQIDEQVKETSKKIQGKVSSIKMPRIKKVVASKKGLNMELADASEEAPVKKPVRALKTNAHRKPIGRADVKIAKDEEGE